MNEQYFEISLNRSQAENITLNLPEGYSLISTEMRRKNKVQTKQHHDDIMFDPQFIKHQQKNHLKLTQEQNKLVNETLMIIQPNLWRFHILEEIISKYQQDIVGIQQIHFKVLRNKYKTLNGFLADLKCLTNNKKLKSLNKLYKEQAEIINEKLQKLRQKCEERDITKTENIEGNKHINSDPKKSKKSQNLFTRQQLRELENNLHQLQNKYLYRIRNIISSNQSLRENKSKQTEELNLLKLSVDEQKKLLAYSRNCLKQQDQQNKKIKQQQRSGQSDFESD